MGNERTRPLDLRLYLPAVACWAGTLLGLALPGDLAHHLGNGLRESIGAVAGLGLAAGTGLTVMLVRGRDPSRRLAVVVLTSLLCGATGGAVRVIAVQAGPVPGWAADRATIEAVAVILTDPQTRTRASGPSNGTTYTIFRVRLGEVRARGRSVRVRTPVVVIADERWVGLLPGQTVRIEGRLGPTERRGPEAAVVRARDGPEVLSEPSLAYRLAEPLREGLRSSMAGRSPEPGGLVPALVIGDESGVTPELRGDLATTGLTHLTAVSGANVAVIVAAVLGLARWGGVRGYGLPAVGILAVVGFVVLARPQPSVVRAAAMGLVAVAGLAAGSRQRGVAALGSAVLSLLLLDPWLARSPGFVLSVLATAGILLLAPAWRDAAGRWLPKLMAEGLAVPLAAQVATLPVLVALTQSVSLVGLPANIVVAPAVAPATILGAAAAGVGPVLPWLAGLLGRVAVLPAGWIVWVAHRGADLPGAMATWPGGFAGVAGAIVMTLIIVALAPAVLRRWAAAGFAGLLLVIVIMQPVRLGWPPKGWLLAACDVGQGDALVVRTGSDSALLIDAGPDPGAVDGCLGRLRVETVSEIVLTHFHADHVEGLPGALRQRAVGEIVVSPFPQPREEAERVRHWAAAADVPVSVAQAGERRVLGDASWEVIWPRRLIQGQGSDANNASVVLLVEVSGLRVLLTGDVEPAAQRAIRAATPDLVVDVLKVPHHGSAHQDDGFLAATDPSLALISVGEDNGYGHPAPEVIESLERSGTRVFRTDEAGTVVVVLEDGRLGVVKQ